MVLKSQPAGFSKYLETVLVRVAACWLRVVRRFQRRPFLCRRPQQLLCGSVGTQRTVILFFASQSIQEENEKMFNLQLHITPQTEQRLKTILAHTQDQETFAQNIIAYQISELQKGIVNIHLDLKKFEEKYTQSSEKFYQQYTQGQTDDSENAMLWAGLYEMLRDNESKLRQLA